MSDGAAFGVKTIAGGAASPRGVVGCTYFGTEYADPDDPARHFEERRKRCYELCTAAVLFGSTPAGTIIVHGSIDGHTGFGRIGHAWLYLPNDMAWEPITGDLYRTKEAWLAYADARPEHIYTKRQAQRLVVTTESYGPWRPPLYR